MVVAFPVKSLGRYLTPLLLLGTSVDLCLAPQPPREPTLAERASLADTYLKKRLTLWQDRLQLNDWSILLEIAESKTLRPGTLGNIHWNADDKEARIRVLSPAEYQMPYRAALRDMEFTVVHELIHLELASLPRSEASRGDEEHAVNQMADALLALDRGEPNYQ